MDFITPINVIILLALLVAMIFVQIFLSKQVSKWLGFVLPIITFLNSIVIALAIFVDDQSTSEKLFTVLSTFILVNIPTIMLLLIYFIVRRKQQPNNKVNQM